MLILVWLGFIPLAIGNGLLRERVLQGLLGPVWAQVVSGVLLMALIFGWAWVSVAWLENDRASGWLRVGLSWLFLTVVFESAMGRAAGKSWGQIAAAYAFEGGNLWSVVVVWIGVVPLLVAGLRGKII